MRLLWFTWKDREHPQAGGAEVVNEELAKRLVRDGHEVIFLVSGFSNAKQKEIIDGYTVIRLGGRFSVYWLAYRYYKKNLQGWADLVIDEMNTVPFFANFYVKEKHIMFVHQLCREIWFYQMKLPLSMIGYLLEPIYLWLLRNEQVITISDSSKHDLMRYGFKQKNIHIISEGIELKPVSDLSLIQKYEKPTILSLGAIREMKRTSHQIKAFEIAKKSIPDLRMKIAGDASGKYGKKVLQMIERSQYKDDIEYCGRVSVEQKIELMQRSHAILVTSKKEGWGLIVTEANSQGTPALVYDVDGLRDSVRNGVTGVISNNNTSIGLANIIVSFFRDPGKCAILQKSAWEWSQSFSFDKSYREFLSIIQKT